MHILENSKVRIGVNQKGAELSSFFDKGTSQEYIWQADASFWGRHAPILFPLVGQVEDGIFCVEGKSYSMGQHGFARDNNFQVVTEEKDTLVFELSSSSETKKVYPYDFLLKVTYRLVENKVVITYSVKNIDSQQIFFNLGAHPGFSIPFEGNLNFSDYYLEFSSKETLDRMQLNSKGLLSGEKTSRYLDNNNVIPLDYKMFDDDALIFERVQSDYLYIKSKKSTRSLKFGLGNFPFLGIWTKPKASAPFICIEPWYGHTAIEGANKELSYRSGVSSLMPSEVLEDSFSIELD